jgi:hypothetical protein
LAIEYFYNKLLILINYYKNILWEVIWEEN